MDKVLWAIGSFEPFKSPGPDGIFPAMLQKAPTQVISGLCKLFEAALSLCHTPATWKSSKIVFIPKPGRNDYHLPKSFRPISLSSVYLKTLEKLVDRHIRGTYLTVNELSNDQHAFRGGRSTDSALHALVYDVEKSLQAKESVLCAFLDIEGAFDNTLSESIMRAAADKGVSRGLVSWIGSALADRHLTVTINGTTITRTTGRGCPQGSVLAPLDWILVIDGLLRLLRREGFACHGYADDIVIAIRGKFKATLCEVMQRALKTVEQWCAQHKLTVNPSKSNLMFFTRSRDNVLPTLPKLFGETIPRSREVKHLGVILDEKLNWKPNLEHRINKATNAFWMIRKAVGNTWGLSPKTIMWMYNTIIIPFFVHGGVVWWHKKDTVTRNKLTSLQRLATLNTTRAMTTTPSKALDALLHLPALDTRLEETAMRTAMRLSMNGLWHAVAARPVEGHSKKIDKWLQGQPIALCDWSPTRYFFDRPYNVQRSLGTPLGLPRPTGE